MRQNAAHSMVTAKKRSRGRFLNLVVQHDQAARLNRIQATGTRGGCAFGDSRSPVRELELWFQQLFRYSARQLTLINVSTAINVCCADYYPAFSVLVVFGALAAQHGVRLRFLWTLYKGPPAPQRTRLHAYRAHPSITAQLTRKWYLTKSAMSGG
jgi:hypothetical protein